MAKLTPSINKILQKYARVFQSGLFFYHQLSLVLYTMTMKSLQELDIDEAANGHDNDNLSSGNYLVLINFLKMW